MTAVNTVCAVGAGGHGHGHGHGRGAPGASHPQEDKKEAEVSVPGMVLRGGHGPMASRRFPRVLVFLIKLEVVLGPKSNGDLLLETVSDGGCTRHEGMDRTGLRVESSSSRSHELDMTWTSHELRLACVSRGGWRVRWMGYDFDAYLFPARTATGRWWIGFLFLS